MKIIKLQVKLLLDLAMFVVLTLLFWKSNFGMQFHEIAGLSVLVVFLLHVLWNWRWVINVTKHFFRKGISFRTRLGWIVNAGLLVCFLIIGVSGVFMSRVLFHFSVGGNWKTPHYFCSALALILVGIHIGLHWPMIGNIFRSKLHVHPPLTKTITVCFAAAVIVVGIYSIPTTSFSRWLVMPFLTQNTTNITKDARPPFEDQQQGIQNHGEALPSSDAQSGTQLPEKEPNASNELDGNSREIGHSRTQESANAGAILWKCVQYGSICILISMITGGIYYLMTAEQF